MFIIRKIFPTTQCIITFLMILVGILLVMAFNYNVDYMGWNTPQIINFPFENSRKYNAVIAKTMDYDALIMGSSLSANFKCTDLDSQFKVKSLKLTISAANISEVLYTVRYANKFQKINLLLCDLHFPSFFDLSPKYPRIPTEVYESQRMLIRELITFSTLYHSLKHCFGKDNTIARDSLYSNEHTFIVNKKNYAKFMLGNPWTLPPISDKNLTTIHSRIQNYLVPLLEENKDKEIFLFFPPYSAMLYEKTNLPTFLAFKKLIAQAVLKYPNVRLYDFQAERAIVENWDHYKDQIHYSAQINTWIIHQLSCDKYRITNKNLDSKLNSFCDYVSSLNFSTFYEDLRKINAH